MNGRDPYPALTVRPVQADDAERVRRLFERLSPESIYRRFFTLFPAPPLNVVRHLTQRPTAGPIRRIQLLRR